MHRCWPWCRTVNIRGLHYISVGGLLFPCCIYCLGFQLNIYHSVLDCWKVCFYRNFKSSVKYKVLIFLTTWSLLLSCDRCHTWSHKVCNSFIYFIQSCNILWWCWERWRFKMVELYDIWLKIGEKCHIIVQLCTKKKQMLTSLCCCFRLSRSWKALWEI